MLDLDDVSMHVTKCLVAKNDDSGLWHRRLRHVHFDLLNKISSKNLVVGLPKIKFHKTICVMLAKWERKQQCRLNRRRLFRHQNLLSLSI